MSIEFIKKFVLYAKGMVKPVLTDEARERISDLYDSLRQKQAMKTLPITARTLESIIRISTAHAKCRLSKDVTVDDVEAAYNVLNFAMFNEAAPIRKSTKYESSTPTTLARCPTAVLGSGVAVTNARPALPLSYTSGVTARGTQPCPVMTVVLMTMMTRMTMAKMVGDAATRAPDTRMSSPLTPYCAHKMSLLQSHQSHQRHESASVPANQHDAHLAAPHARRRYTALTHTHNTTASHGLPIVTHLTLSYATD